MQRSEDRSGYECIYDSMLMARKGEGSAKSRLMYQTMLAIGEIVSHTKSDGNYTVYYDDAEMGFQVITPVGLYTIPANLLVGKLQALLNELVKNHVTYHVGAR